MSRKKKTTGAATSKGAPREPSIGAEAETSPDTERPAHLDQNGVTSDAEDPGHGTERKLSVAPAVGIVDSETTVDLRGDPSDAFMALRDDARERGEHGDAATSDPDLADADTDTDASKIADAASIELQRSHLRGLIESLVFVSDRPIKTADLAKAASAPLKEVKSLLAELEQDYQARGIQLAEIAGGWMFRTNAQFAPFVRDLTKQKPVKLTRAQVETLAILAYRQPITRPEIDDIRGVDCGAVLKLLLERDLIRILGKKDEPGRPILYGTTTAFLEFFGLKSLKDLPTLREFTELNEDSRRVVEQELGDVLDARQPAAEALEQALGASGGASRGAHGAADADERASRSDVGGGGDDGAVDSSMTERPPEQGEHMAHDTLPPARMPGPWESAAEGGEDAEDDEDEDEEDEDEWDDDDDDDDDESDDEPATEKSDDDSDKNDKTSKSGNKKSDE